MSYEIQVRRDSSTNWTSTNPVLAQGEMGLELDTGFMKIGDGSTAWTSLSYWGGSGISGFSGFSGSTGSAGASGFSGSNGMSGFSGFSGASGSGANPKAYAMTTITQLDLSPPSGWSPISGSWNTSWPLSNCEINSTYGTITVGNTGIYQLQANFYSWSSGVDVGYTQNGSVVMAIGNNSNDILLNVYVSCTAGDQIGLIYWMATGSVSGGEIQFLLFQLA